MKQLITTLLFAWSTLNVTAQITFGQGSMSSAYYDSAGLSISIIMSGKDSGNIHIEGDTMRAIKLLIKAYQYERKTQYEMQQNYIKQHKTIDTGVDFLNQLPDFWKENNCKWPAYLQSLKKTGYYISKKATRIKPCP